jgi:hypothetical protein
MRPVKKRKGSLLVFVVLLLFFIIPGLIYAAWGLSSGFMICPKCGSREFVPISTPKGKQLRARFH